jgi:hypothetical protein
MMELKTKDQIIAKMNEIIVTAKTVKILLTQKGIDEVEVMDLAVEKLGFLVEDVSNTILGECTMFMDGNNGIRGNAAPMEG